MFCLLRIQLTVVCSCITSWWNLTLSEAILLPQTASCRDVGVKHVLCVDIICAAHQQFGYIFHLICWQYYLAPLMSSWHYSQNRKCCLKESECIIHSCTIVPLGAYNVYKYQEGKILQFFILFLIAMVKQTRAMLNAEITSADQISILHQTVKTIPPPLPQSHQKVWCY